MYRYVLMGSRYEKYSDIPIIDELLIVAVNDEEALKEAERAIPRLTELYRKDGARYQPLQLEKRWVETVKDYKIYVF